MQNKTDSHFFKTKNLSELFPNTKQISLGGKFGKGQRLNHDKHPLPEKQIKKYASYKLN